MSENQTIYVTRDQIESAQLAIKIAGGEDKVDPLVVRIAHAKRASEDAPEDATDREAS